MNPPPGSSRNVIKHNHALFTPAGFVTSNVPGWTGCTPHVLISPRLGSAKFVQMNILFGEGARASIGAASEVQTFLFVIEGACSLATGDKSHGLSAGHYAFLPRNEPFELSGTAGGARLLVFQKAFEPLVGEAPPAAVIGDSSAIEGKPFLGNERARLQTLLPDVPAFDMAVNIFTYEPGATLPFVETHVMEHGLLMLDGAGIYRLDSDWYPVEAGDVIWMAPYCPQWFVAMGDVPARYIYYKDVNRSVL